MVSVLPLSTHQRPIVQAWDSEELLQDAKSTPMRMPAGTGTSLLSPIASAACFAATRLQREQSSSSSSSLPRTSLDAPLMLGPSLFDACSQVELQQQPHTVTAALRGLESKQLRQKSWGRKKHLLTRTTRLCALHPTTTPLRSALQRPDGVRKSELQGLHVQFDPDVKVFSIASRRDSSKHGPSVGISCEDCNEKLPLGTLVKRVSRRPPIYRCVLCLEAGDYLGPATSESSIGSTAHFRDWRLQISDAGEVYYVHRTGRRQREPFWGCPKTVAAAVVLARQQQREKITGSAAVHGTRAADNEAAPSMSVTGRAL
eukprot:gnl/TRDRNA2_/TRDRNA2_72559_c0_seq1.p1 gnl/TRDRNA2_/TRDRNA2_72559_c0~~gnl/TRDRNA2_/TRDRNA2_72559_c0_seq1.p1  ORF type:complete len:315 (+),score=36.67 gnl/TRDRNA2_/TRDRNA2_72559_c0_seq1:55-999(+)